MQRTDRVLRVLDPTGLLPQVDTSRPAPRLASLLGCRLGIIVNEPGSALVTNWEEISTRLEHALDGRFGFADVHREIKPRMSAPAPHDLIRRVIEKTQAVINGLGK